MHDVVFAVRLVEEALLEDLLLSQKHGLIVDLVKRVILVVAVDDLGEDLHWISLDRLVERIHQLFQVNALAEEVEEADNFVVVLLQQFHVLSVLLLELLVFDLSQSLGRGRLGTHLDSLRFRGGLRLRLFVNGPREFVFPVLFINLFLLCVNLDFVFVLVVHHEKLHELFSDFISLCSQLFVASTLAHTNVIWAAV